MIFLDLFVWHATVSLWDVYCVSLVVLLDGCTREKWWALVFSPKRACLAYARFTKARPSYFTRVVAQATRTIFQRANVSLKQEGSRLSENMH